MAKKELRKAREAEERKLSGVPVKTPAAAGESPVSGKTVKKALRAARPAKPAGEAGGEPTT